MVIDYNQGHIAEQYAEAKTQPWRDRIETWSFLNLIGDLEGRSVLDAACGQGFFTRILRRAGAAKVVGLDISERMIEMALEQEASENLGIDYVVGDARDILAQQDFDLVVSAWLLVYARSRTELARMCRGLATRVKPGGRFVTVTTNPGVYSFGPSPDYSKYGFEMKLADRAYDGAPIRFSLHLADSTLEIENYYLPLEAYAAAFRDAGFRDFAVHYPEVSPNPQGNDDSAHWRNFLEHPILVCMDCVKV